MVFSQHAVPDDGTNDTVYNLFVVGIIIIIVTLVALMIWGIP